MEKPPKHPFQSVIKIDSGDIPGVYFLYFFDYFYAFSGDSY